MASVVAGRPPAPTMFQTRHGRALHGPAEDILSSSAMERFRGEIQLIFTSPPFPLLSQKRYGNKAGEAYLQWLASFAPLFTDYLAPTGSIVIELGNSWMEGLPEMSTLPLESLLAFRERANLHLCQQFIWHNPARLPSPAQWVNIERIRVKDSFTHIWWMSPNHKPEANNRRVLVEYSESMKRLLKTGNYNSGLRPSEHSIGSSSFNTDNGGAIPSNVLCVANTRSNDGYQEYCRKYGLDIHPARMPIEVAEFFINLLTTPDDIVLDPFAGSNITGKAAEILGRQWISIEKNAEYIRGAQGRFEHLTLEVGTHSSC